MKNNQEMEYELTYLAAFIPKEISEARWIYMKDVYFPSDPNGNPNLRFRQSGSTFVATKKDHMNPNDASISIETNIPLTEQEYMEIIENWERKIEKNRYKITIDGQSAEFDIFEGDLQGLVLIDFEFASEQEMRKFKQPPCCLVEVTQENFIAWGTLSWKHFNDIEKKLETFKYTPLYI